MIALSAPSERRYGRLLRVVRNLVNDSTVGAIVRVIGLNEKIVVIISAVKTVD
jgi:hypothetical protein